MYSIPVSKEDARTMARYPKQKAASIADDVRRHVYQHLEGRDWAHISTLTEDPIVARVEVRFPDCTGIGWGKDEWALEDMIRGELFIRIDGPKTQFAKLSKVCTDGTNFEWQGVLVDVPRENPDELSVWVTGKKSPHEVISELAKLAEAVAGA